MGDEGVTKAGAFSIPPLEGSRFGTVVLWVLNGAEKGEGWGMRKSIGFKRGNRSSRKDFPEPRRLTCGTADTVVALMFR